VKCQRISYIVFAAAPAGAVMQEAERALWRARHSVTAGCDHLSEQGVERIVLYSTTEE
jgi:hypothetical protein